MAFRAFALVAGTLLGISSPCSAGVISIASSAISHTPFFEGTPAEGSFLAPGCPGYFLCETAVDLQLGVPALRTTNAYLINLGEYSAQNAPAPESYLLSSNLLLNGQVVPITQTLNIAQIGNGQFQIEITEYVTSINLTSVGTVALKASGTLFHVLSNRTAVPLLRTQFTLTSEATQVPGPAGLGLLAFGVADLLPVFRPLIT